MKIAIPVREQQFAPIQEELSTERREKIEKEDEPYKQNGKDNIYSKIDQKYEIVNNGINSYITTKHSKRYSIDVCEKGTKLRIDNLSEKPNKEEKLSLLSTPTVDHEKKKQQALEKGQNIKQGDKVKVIKIEPYSVFHTVEADRDVSLEHSKDNKFNATNHFFSTPKTGKDSLGGTRGDMKFLMEKKIKLVLDNKKKDDKQLPTSKASANITTLQIEKGKKEDKTVKNFKINHNLQEILQKGMKVKLRNVQENLNTKK